LLPGDYADSIIRFAAVLGSLTPWQALRLRGVWQSLLQEFTYAADKAMTRIWDSTLSARVLEPWADATSAQIEAMLRHQRPLLTRQQCPQADQHQQQLQGQQQRLRLQLPPAGLLAVANLLVACLTDSAGPGAGLVRPEAAKDAGCSRIDDRRIADHAIREVFGQLASLLVCCSGGADGLAVLEQLLSAWQAVLPAAAAALAPGDAAPAFANAGGAAAAAAAAAATAARGRIAETAAKHPEQAAQYLQRLLAAVFAAADQAEEAAAGLSGLRCAVRKPLLKADAWLSQAHFEKITKHDPKFLLATEAVAQLPALRQLVGSSSFAAALQWVQAWLWKRKAFSTEQYRTAPWSSIDDKLRWWLQWLGQVQQNAAAAAGGDEDMGSQQPVHEAAAAGRQATELAVQQLVICAQSVADAPLAAGGSSRRGLSGSRRPKPASPAYLAKALWAAVDWWCSVRSKGSASALDLTLQAGIQVGPASEARTGASCI